MLFRDWNLSSRDGCFSSRSLGNFVKKKPSHSCFTTRACRPSFSWPSFSCSSHAARKSRRRTTSLHSPIGATTTRVSTRQQKDLVWWRKRSTPRKFSFWVSIPPHRFLAVRILCALHAVALCVTARAHARGCGCACSVMVDSRGSEYGVCACACACLCACTCDACT